MVCKDCVHFSVCKFADEEVCKGTKVKDLSHDCKDYKESVVEIIRCKVDAFRNYIIRRGLGRMTNEEAIKTIQVAIAEVEWDYPLDYSIAFDLAAKSLDKQIPKKPLNPDGRYAGKAKGGNCPVCGAHTNSSTYNYCRKCGQALDWSDTE